MNPVYPILVCGLDEGLHHKNGTRVDCAHCEKFRKKFCSEQRVIGSPEFGGTRHETLVVDSQLLGDFRARDDFLKSLVPSRVGVLEVEISFDLGRREGPEDEGDDLAFDEVEVNRCGKTEMTLVRQVQEFYAEIGNRSAVDDALSDISEVDGEVLGNKKSFAVRVSPTERTKNGTVRKDMGVVFITSIVECGCDLDFEGEDTSDYLNGREIVMGDRRDVGK